MGFIVTLMQYACVYKQSLNFSQFAVIHTLKGFSIVNKTYTTKTHTPTQLSLAFQICPMQLPHLSTEGQETEIGRNNRL